MLRLERLAAAGLGLVLIVVFASAAIRLGAEGTAVAVLRALHRSAASGAALVVVLLAWVAWRSRRSGKAAGLAAALVALLSAIGIAGGQSPPFAASMGNILGGLALAATFAWLASSSGRGTGALMAMLALQCALGAWLSLAWRDSPFVVMVPHALLGIALAVATAALALRLRVAWQRLALLGLALAAPAAGIAALFLDRAFAAALAHASTVALLVAAVAWAQPRAA